MKDNPSADDRLLTDEETIAFNIELAAIKDAVLQITTKYGGEKPPPSASMELICLVQFMGVLLYSAYKGSIPEPGDVSTLFWSLINTAFNIGRAYAMPKPKTEIIQ